MKTLLFEIFTRLYFLIWPSGPHGDSRERVSNSAEREVAFNVGIEVPIAEKEWIKVSPYGVFPGRTPGREQHFNRPEAETVVSEFNSFRGRLTRAFKGRPFFIGHPDVDPKTYPDQRRLGKFVALDAREDGLYAKAEWNSLGRENLKEEFWLYPSPLWDAPAGRAKFAPDRLISIGLTNTPRIAGSEPVANAEDLGTNSNKENEKMDRTLLLEKLGLEATATDEEILAALDKLITDASGMKEEAAKTEAEKTAREETENSLAASTGKITTLESHLSKARESHANSLIGSAVADGRVTGADKSDWESKFSVADSPESFEAVANALGAIKPTLNTKALELEKSRKAVSDERGRREAVANAISAVMTANPGISHIEANKRVKNDPEMKLIFDAMQEPGREQS